jgi:uncharacterized YccA/Bax inhibitor family protein
MGAFQERAHFVIDISPSARIIAPVHPFTPMRTSNPLLTDSTFTSQGYAAQGTQVMTLKGTANATLMLVLMMMAAASYTWKIAMQNPANAGGWIIGGAISGFVLVLVTNWKKEWAAITGSLYAIAEGLFLGGLSAMYEHQFNGIVIQAVLLTGGTLIALLAAYSMRIIKATENFKLGVFAATGGIALVYLVSIVLGFFGIHIPFIHSNGTFGILFGIAAFNLVIDFAQIEQAANEGMPKYMEWYGAFALLVTLVWLYHDGDAAFHDEVFHMIALRLDVVIRAQDHGLVAVLGGFFGEGIADDLKERILQRQQRSPDQPPGHRGHSGICGLLSTTRCQQEQTDGNQQLFPKGGDHPLSLRAQDRTQPLW